MFCFCIFHAFSIQTLQFLLVGAQKYILPQSVGYPSYATDYFSKELSIKNIRTKNREKLFPSPLSEKCLHRLNPLVRADSS